MLPQFSYSVVAALSLVLALSGCNSYSPPPQPITVGLSLMVASVQAGIGTQSFTATVQYDTKNLGVNWTLTQAGASCTPGCGTISAQTSASGAPITYTAPASLPNPTSVALTATSVSDSSKSQAATITVTPAVSVGVTPTPISVQFNAIQFFTATVQNDAANQGVNWTMSGPGCSGATCGTVSPNTSLSGVPIKYTGPNSVPAPSTVTLTATSKTDPARNGPAAITVTPNPGTTAVTISPLRAAITTGQTQTFVATVTGASDMTVTWEVDGIAGGSAASLGTIDSNGKYTPPTTGTLGASHTITAVSNADVTKNTTAPIGVTDLPGVYTYHNDNSRTGGNLKEFALTTSPTSPFPPISASTFGKLFSCTMDAAIVAQPLWVANQNIGGGTHNVLYVASERGTLYAFDADSSSCVKFWQTGANGLSSLIPSGETWATSSSVNCGDLAPDVGLTSTPVIDPATSTIYLVAKTKDTTTLAFHQRLHALDLLTGNEKPSSPVEVQATVPGTGAGSVNSMLSFDPKINAQRPALLLEIDASSKKHLVISWASHCDIGQYHGWVMSYSPGTLAQEAIYNVSPNAPGLLGGIWMAGNGPAADSSGNIYFATGNGTFDVNTGGTSYGDAIVKLGPPASGVFPVLSYFAPLDQATLEAQDTDLGSGGLLLLPDLLSGTHKQLLVQAGKDGRIFLTDRTALGGFSSSSNNVVQEVDGQIPGGMWGSPAYWNGNVYFGSQGNVLNAFPFSAGASPLGTSPSSQSLQSFGYPGTTPSLSSNGNLNGIVWTLDNSNLGPSNGQILYAYDATNLATLLYSSTQAAGGRDNSGGAVKFNVPTVANGKVYVGGQSTLTVYGLLPN